MKSQPIDIAGMRREQIVEAAVAVITEKGLQNLSLSEIETKAGMSRGQLTYYFPTKEDILLAVFDRLVQLTYERIGTPSGQPCVEEGGWEWVEHLFRKLVARAPVNPEFACLQYTFLSQIAHREDFRERLAKLYEFWRTGMAEGLSADMKMQPAARRVSPRALASLVQALLHGLSVQKAADPNAFDHEEVVELCLDVLGTYLWAKSNHAAERRNHSKKTVPSARAAKTRPWKSRVTSKGVNGDGKSKQ
jgi:AcrR family transcriptional regulator